MPGTGLGTVDDMVTGSGSGRQQDESEPTPEGESDSANTEVGRGTGHRDTVLGSAVSWSARWSLRLLLIAAALVGILYLVSRLWVIVLPVVLALLLSTVLWPAVRWLRQKLPPALAVLLVLFVAAVGLTGLGFWIAPQVIGQSGALAASVSSGLTSLRTWLTGPPLNLGSDQIGDVIDDAIAALQRNASSIASGVLSSVGTIGSILTNAVLAVLLSFFFLKDGPKFLPWLSRWVGPNAAPHAVEILERCWSTLSGFIRAQTAVGLIDAVAIGIGLVVLDVPLALPLAVLIFFGAFVPFIGATVTGALAAVVALVSNGLGPALIVVALILVVQQLEGNVLQPLLMSRALSLHPVVVALGVVAGGSLFGILGAFLAVPVVAVASVVFGYAREQLVEVAEARTVSD